MPKSILTIIFFSIIIIACGSADSEFLESALLTHHPLVLEDEKPLSISSQLDGLVTMVVVGKSDFFVDIVIHNNSERLIVTNHYYTVEIYLSGTWLPIQWPEDLIFSASMGEAIEPHSSIEMQKRLPNLIPFLPLYSLPLESGRYRLRTTIGIHNSSVVHDVAAEFYVD